MSDVYGPFDEFLQRESATARANAVEGVDDNPDEAARAQEISQVTGAPPALVYGDLENFENQHRSALTAQLVTDNAFLQQYINTNPLASRVSNDDYGQLDNVSAQVRGIENTSVLGEAAKGFKEGFSHAPESFAAYQKWLRETPLFGNLAVRGVAEGAGLAFLLTSGLFAGGIYGTAGAVGEIAKELGENEAEANRLTRDIVKMAEVGLFEMPFRPAGLTEPLIMREIRQVHRAARPYVKEGQEPPVGLHPIIDDIKRNQAEVDLEQLKLALDESIKSATRERAPELFQNYIKQHTDADIGIPADAIRELYGEQVPAAGDGVLGWVPNLRQRLELAEQTGGDVTIPVSEWLAKVDPAVAKQLEESIRVREAGMTKLEAAEPPKQMEMFEPEGKPVTVESLDTVRESSGLMPRPSPAVTDITKERFLRYQRLIEKQREADVEWHTKRALADVKRRQTKEWKENEAKVREQVVEEFSERPDLVADKLFKQGVLFDKKLETRTKLDEALLTPEQKAALPDSYYSKNGIPADDVALLFDYENGAALIDDLIRLEADRAALGLRPMDYTRRLIADETTRRMEERFGKLEENILEAAKEQVLSKLEIDKLEEEALITAIESGMEYGPAKEALRAAVRKAVDAFEQMPLKEAKSDRLLADIGRADRRLEGHLLKEKTDYRQALVERERKYIAGVLARRSVEVEQLRQKFDKVATPYLKDKIDRVDRATANYVQALLSQAGLRGKLTPDEIMKSIEFEGTGTLSDFVLDKKGMGWAPVVSDRIMGSGPGRMDTMSIADFREFVDAIESLNFIGRQEKKITIAGEAKDFAEFKAEVKANLEARKMRPKGHSNFFYHIDAMTTKMEELVKALDLRKELGPLYRAVIEPMVLSKAKEFDLLTDLSKHFEGMQGKYKGKWRKSLSDSIPNDFIMDPWENTLYDLTRSNLLQIALHWGNASSLEKFSRGFAGVELGRPATKVEGEAFAIRVKALIDEHLTKEDWDWIQDITGPFKKWQPMMDTVSRNVSGRPPKWIEGQPVETPFGTLEGWYWPVKYDQWASNIGVIKERVSKDAILGSDYFQASTAKGHLKERTGYIDIVDINKSLEQVASVMQQTIHDIAFRDATVQVSRIFRDKEIRMAIKKHYGKEYDDQLVPWLKRVANKYTADESSIRALNSLQRRVRGKFVGHVIPLNFNIVFSPMVGIPNPKDWGRFWINRGANKKFALEHSDEVRHMVYNIDRDFRSQMETLQSNSTLKSMHKKAIEWAVRKTYGLDKEFRMATFYNEYYKAKGRGLSDHEAKVVADSFVRERHGAASAVDLPAIMNSNETVKSLTVFYTYFNTMQNWRRQIPDAIRLGEKKKLPAIITGSTVVGAAYGAALFNEFDEDASWAEIIWKSIAIEILSGIPISKEITSYALQGYNPRTPFMAALDITDQALADAMRHYKGKRTKRPLSNLSNIIGLSTGLPMMQVGRSSQFMLDVSQRKQRPKNIFEWARGIRTGKIEQRRR